MINIAYEYQIKPNYYKMKTITEMGMISIPNNPVFVPAAIAYASKITEISGFSPDDCLKIQLALLTSTLGHPNKFSKNFH